MLYLTEYYYYSNIFNMTMHAHAHALSDIINYNIGILYYTHSMRDVNSYLGGGQVEVPSLQKSSSTANSVLCQCSMITL